MSDKKDYTITSVLEETIFKFASSGKILSEGETFRYTSDVNLVCDFKALLKEKDGCKYTESILKASIRIVTPESSRKLTKGENGMIIFSPLHKCLVVSYYHDFLVKGYISTTLKDLAETALEESHTKAAFYSLIHSMFKVKSITPKKDKNEKTKIGDKPKTAGL